MKFNLKTEPMRLKVVVLLLLMAVLITSIAILASVPPVSRDALSHHLAVPQLYLKHGGMYEIAHVPFSYYPMNIDLLYLIPLYFGNDIAAKYIHFSFALLTAGLIFRYLQKQTDPAYALFGALFFLSLPIIVKLSITVYVDLGLVFFTTAAIIYFFKWIENRFNLKYLIFSGCCCGLALGTKYNGLVIWFLLTLFVPLAYIRNNRVGAADQGRALGYGVIFMALALLVFSPWMIRNYHWKQNPIYPLYHSLFSRLTASGPVELPPLIDNETGKAAVKYKAGSDRPRERVGLFGYRQVIYNESWWQIALVPLRIFFSGRDGDPQHFDGRLSPFLFCLPFLAFIRSPRFSSALQFQKWIWLLFALLFLLIAFFMVEMRIRYIAPIIPGLAILSIIGLYQLDMKIRSKFEGGCAGILRMAVPAVMGMMLLGNGVYIINQFREVQPIDYLSGRVGRAAYIERYRKEYPALQYANANLPPGAKILAVFLGNRIYYSDKAMISDVNVLINAFGSSDAPQKMASALRKRGISHLLVRADLFESWLRNNFDENKRECIGLFFKTQLKLIYHKNGYALFEMTE